MGKEIIRPEKIKEVDSKEVKTLRVILCNHSKCTSLECTNCAFYSNDNFDAFISAVGL